MAASASDRPASALVHLGPRPRQAGRRIARPGRRLMPAGVRHVLQRPRQFLAHRFARGLLLGLRSQAARLRPELAEDVLDPREVGFGFDKLFLGPPAAPLVPSDPGHLLEQGPALLGPERECLVDHALPDEQERVVGQMRCVEQIDEIAQSYPLSIEQVVVLA